MVIDFHTHIFPDYLAEHALSVLLTGSNNFYDPVSDATLSGLLKNMDDWGIDRSVVQPVVTKASQVQKTNEWAQSICSDRIISFGGIYPHSADYKAAIDSVVDLGLKGIKFHSEYQDFVVDDPAVMKIYDYALSKGLILMIHAGFDPGFQPPFKSSPRQFANILAAMQGGTIIAAHLGGHDQWDDVERYLVGKDIYFDTSMGFEYYPHEQFKRIVKDHGADKILFASDSPWSSAKTEYEAIQTIGLTQSEMTAITGGNAIRLLGL